MIGLPSLPDLYLVVSSDASQADSLIAEWAKTALSILAGGLTAVLGGFAGSYLSEQFARDRRKAEQLAADKSSAFALQIQLMGMYTDLLQFRESLGQSRVAVRARQGQAFRAQFHQGFAGEQAVVHFRIEDIQALGSYGSEALLNLVADLDRRFNGIAAALNIYRTTWLEMASTMAGEVVGPLIRMALTDDQIRQMTPKLAAQTKILEDLDSMVDEMVHDTYRALVGLHQARVKAHGLRKQFEGIAPTGRYEVIQPDLNAVPPSPKPLNSK